MRRSGAARAGAATQLEGTCSSSSSLWSAAGGPYSGMMRGASRGMCMCVGGAPPPPPLPMKGGGGWGQGQEVGDCNFELTPRLAWVCKAPIMIRARPCMRGIAAVHGRRVDAAGGVVTSRGFGSQRPC